MTRPLSLPSLLLLVPTIILFLYLFSRTTPYNTEQLGPIDKSSVNTRVNWTNAISPQKTAYVYTFTTNRHDASQRFIATLVSIKALQLTNTQRDIVVIVDHGVSGEQIDELKNTGAIVHSLPTPLLFQSHTAPPLPLGDYCYSNFAPVYAFTLTQYERVVWLDADVLPQMNMDEFFLCGEFCLTYSNLQWYIASVMIMKPSIEKYNELLDNLSTRGVMAQKLHQQRMEWFPTISSCQLLFEEYLFQSFYQIESAPLFDSETTGQQNIPQMRLNMGVVMNPIYWYEHYDWNLARGAAYSKMTSNDEDHVPGHSLGFPNVKPYDWIQGIYWNTNWVWAHWRMVLLQESYFPVAVLTLAITGLWYCFGALGLPWIFAQLASAQNHDNQQFRTPQQEREIALKERMHRMSFSHSLVSSLLKLADTFGVSTIATITGIIIVLSTTFLAYKFIPADTPYYLAYPLFAIVLAVFQQVSLQCYVYFLYNGLNGITKYSETRQLVEDIDNGHFPRSSRVYSKEEWDNIHRMADKIITNTNQSIFFFLDSTTGCISPLSQTILFNRIVNWESMVVNMLIIASLYLVNQMKIYSLFAIKIICLFAGFLYCFIAYIQPYLKVLLVAYYAEGGKRSWRRLKLN